MVGIYRQPGIGEVFVDSCNGGYYTVRFFVSADDLCTGFGAGAAYVKNGRTLFLHSFSISEQTIYIAILSFIIETIWRGIKYTHHYRTGYI